jgi:hypothetical protein
MVHGMISINKNYFMFLKLIYTKMITQFIIFNTQTKLINVI